jgi:hypothetical protein
MFMGVEAGLVLLRKAGKLTVPKFSKVERLEMV